MKMPQQNLQKKKMLSLETSDIDDQSFDRRIERFSKRVAAIKPSEESQAMMSEELLNKSAQKLLRIIKTPNRGSSLSDVKSVSPVRQR